MATMAVFLNKMFVVFFARVRPDSSEAKPKCMTKTRKVATSIQVLFAVKRPCETPAAYAAVGVMKVSTDSMGRARTLKNKFFFIYCSFNRVKHCSDHSPLS